MSDDVTIPQRESCCGTRRDCNMPPPGVEGLVSQLLGASVDGGGGGGFWGGGVRPTRGHPWIKSIAVGGRHDLRGVLVATGLRRLEWVARLRIVKNEASIMQDVEHEFVKIKTYRRPRLDTRCDEMGTRQSHRHSESTYGGRHEGGILRRFAVPRRAVAQCARVLGQATPA